MYPALFSLRFPALINTFISVKNDSTHSQRVSESRFVLAKKSIKTVMTSDMCANAWKYVEVFCAIVSLVHVDVMDDFSISERSSKDLFSNPAMYPSGSCTVEFFDFVSMPINVNRSISFSPGGDSKFPRSV